MIPSVQLVSTEIKDMNTQELDAVDGGLLPLFLAAAVAATYVEFSFIDGLFISRSVDYNIHCHFHGRT